MHLDEKYAAIHQEIEHVQMHLLTKGTGGVVTKESQNQAYALAIQIVNLRAQKEIATELYNIHEELKRDREGGFYPPRRS